MRRSRLPLKKLYALTKYMLRKIDLNQQVKKKGRPKKYEERFIIALPLFQILNKRSYRETLETAKNQNFDVPSLSDYHYRVRQLDIADAEGFGFGGKYNLNWKRGR